MKKEETLIDIINALSPKMKLKRILQTVIDSAQEISLSEAGTLFLKDKEKRRAIFEVVNGPYKSILEGETIPLNKGIVGKVISSGKSLIVNYADKEVEFYKNIDKRLGYKTRNILCIPLKIGNDVIGAVEMVNKRKGEYTEEDLNKLKRFSMQSSLIINTALMYQELNRLTFEIGKSEKFLDKVLENVSTGIISLNKDGIILRVNKYFEKVIEKKEDDVMGKHIGDIFPEIRNIFPAIDEKKTLIQYEEKTFEAKITYVNIGKEKYILINFRDLTDTMELQKLQSLENMRQAFLAAVSHELRTPLTSIIGFSSMAMEPTLSKHKIKEYVNIIFKESQKLRGMLETVIDVVKMSDIEAELNRKRLDINLLVMEVMEEFRSITHIHKFKTYLETDIPFIYLDKKWMKRAIYEILENAVKYSPEGGKITAKVRRKDSNAIISIQDEGIGISDDRIPYIFVPLGKADDPLSGRGGLGLGLSIANMIVKAHKGRIEVKNRRKRGLRVNIILPI